MKLGELQKLASTLQGRTAQDLQTHLQTYIQDAGLDPGNLYQELEMTSDLVDTHRDSSTAGSPMSLHSHTFFELLYCCNSCGAEYLVGSERYRLRQGDIVFVPPGVSHRPLLPDAMPEPYERYVLWLSHGFMEKYAQLFPYPFTEKQACASMLRTGSTPWEHLGELFRLGVEEAEQQADGWEAAVVGNTISLLTQIKRATDARTVKGPVAEQPELLDKLMAYVEHNYANPITISELAKQFYVSSSTISHLFTQKMGVSFYRYLTQRRLIAAKSLIEQGILLEQAAAAAGFRDYSGFYRAFRQEYGISPRQYRILQDNSKKP